MDVEAILVNWPICGKQTFVLCIHGGSIWNLALIGKDVSEGKTFEEFFLYVKQVTPGEGPFFYPRAKIWKILVGFHKTKLHAKYQMPELTPFRQEDFQSFA